MFSNILRSLRKSHTTATTYPKSKNIPCTLIPGDGVGPELTDAVRKVFRAAGVPVDFETVVFSEVEPQKSASLEKVAASIARNRVCLHGIVGIPERSVAADTQKNLNMLLRKRLNLFARVVHVKSLPGVDTRHRDVDLVIVREQTEGEYSALEHETVKGVVECLKVTTRRRSEEIAKFAFDYATKHKRKKVTAVHKAAIFKLTDGLFLQACERASRRYPKIHFEARPIDHCSAGMVSTPGRFDLLLAPNLYGTVLENIGAGMVGGAGVVAGASFSPECVVYEPGARHVFAGGTGKDVANPTAMMLCAVGMLGHVNLQGYAGMVGDAVLGVLAEGKVRTRDVGGMASTGEFTEAVIRRLGVGS